VRDNEELLEQKAHRHRGPTVQAGADFHNHAL
jgi:hypothetical protein